MNICIQKLLWKKRSFLVIYSKCFKKSIAFWLQAACCSDHLHCCPNGYTCDVVTSQCHKGDISIPMKRKLPAVQLRNVRSVICPDEQSTCPDGSTCCKLASGQYGCCPLEKVSLCMIFRLCVELQSCLFSVIFLTDRAARHRQIIMYIKFSCAQLLCFTQKKGSLNWNKDERIYLYSF